ncbi:MAG TPA: serine hydrolase [Kofleriaceae bacterium]
MKLALVLLVACAAPRQAPHVDDLDGLWGADVVSTHQTAGQLTIARAGDAWTATIAGTTATLTRDGDWWKSDLGTGELRLAPERGEAFWLQSPGVAIDLAFATPLALSPTGSGFTATVTPLPDRLELYLTIAGTRAWIREPGHNVGAMVRDLRVARAGNAVVLSRADGRVALRGTLGARGLHVELVGFDIALDLTKRSSRADAPGFYPRVTTAPYHYAPPAPGNGWPASTLAAEGMRDAPIEQLVRHIIDAVPTAWNSPAIQALVIARHGKLVVEEYFDGFTRATPHDTRSAGKSWSSALIGAAVDRGELTDATKLAGDDPDPRKAQITLAHLLTMSSGLSCDDDDDASPGNESTMQAQKADRDWQHYALALPMIRSPGERAVYCSGAINLVGVLLARATHAWIPALWNRDLAAPLGITHYYLDLQPNEQGYLAGGVYLEPLDFAKLAQVFLDRGRWQGKPIVSADWVARSVAAHASIHEPDDYGYAWWRRTLVVAGREHAAFYASGNGGQIAMAIPDLDLVVAIMAGNYGDFRTWKHFIDDDIASFVIPSVGK